MQKAFSGLLLAAFLFLPGICLAAEIGECATSSEGKHIFWPVADGKKLFGAVQDLKFEKERISLLNLKLEIKDELILLWKTQTEAADKAVTTQTKALTASIQTNNALQTANQNLLLQAARYKGECYQWLIWGFVGGVGVATVVGILVAVVVGRTIAK